MTFMIKFLFVMGLFFVWEFLHGESMGGDSIRKSYYHEEYYAYFRLDEWDYSFFLSGRLMKNDLEGMWKRTMKKDVSQRYKPLLTYHSGAAFGNGKMRDHVHVFRGAGGKILRVDTYRVDVGIEDSYRFDYDDGGRLVEVRYFLSNQKSLHERRILSYRGTGQDIRSVKCVGSSGRDDRLKYVSHYYEVGSDELLITHLTPNEEIRWVTWYRVEKNGVRFYKEKRYDIDPYKGSVRFEVLPLGTESKVGLEPVKVSELLRHRFEIFLDVDVERALWYGLGEHVIFEKRKNALGKILYYEGGFLKTQVIAGDGMEGEMRLGGNEKRISKVIRGANVNVLWGSYEVIDYDPYNKALVQKRIFREQLIRSDTLWRDEEVLLRTRYTYHPNRSLKSKIHYQEGRVMEREMYPILRESNDF